MKKYKCGNCGYEMRKFVKYCPECGQEIEQPTSLYSDNKNVGIEKSQGYIYLLKKINFKVVVIGGVGLAVLIIFMCVFNNKYNRFIRNYNAGKTDAIKANYEKYDDKDIDKVYKYLSEEVHSIKDDYFNEKITYTETQERLKKVLESCKSGKSLPDYASCKADIEKLYASRKEFDKAEEAYNIGKYENAYDSYKKVESIDKSYETAQNKIEELKPIIAKQYYDSAKDKYDGQAYTAALTDINKALYYNFDDKYKELKQLCQQAENEAKAAKAEADRQKKLLVSGKQISTTRFDIEYVGADFTTKILPERTSGSYFYSNCPNDSIYVDMKFYVTNKSDYSATIDFVKNFSATYGTKSYTTNYEYYCELGSNNLDNIYDWTNIAPLKKIAYHVVLKLPYEAINTNDSITVKFKIDGEEQLLEFR